MILTDRACLCAVYRRVAVEKAVLSDVSGSGVHAETRLLEFHSGQSALKLRRRGRTGGGHQPATERLKSPF